MPDRLHITVMLGGPSAERAVSLLSGAAVVQVLCALGHTVAQLDPRDDSWALPAGTDVVFLALHGTYGEDGTVQRRLAASGVPHTGCDSQASRTALDSVGTKKRCLAAGGPPGRDEVFPRVKSHSPAGRQPRRYLRQATTRRIQQAALAAFRAVNGRDYGRVDVMVQSNGTPVVLEVNTLPGMTETSLLPKAAAAAGISFPELCQRMIDLAMQRRAPAEIRMTNDE